MSGRRIDEEEEDENDTVFCLLTALAEEDDADADVDDWPESVRETGSVVMAVVGAALGVVIVIPGLLARMVVVVAVVETLVDAALRVVVPCVSDGRVGSGGGIDS